MPDLARERMSDVEALMWGLETDPHLSSNFAVLTFYDTAPEPERLRRRMWRTSRVVPRLRRRVVAGLGPLANPAWEEDADFDLDRHLRTVSLPTGATDADARALAAQLAAEPFDREHPLWQFTVIEGLPDGRAAMVQKMHHTITDGEGGIRMSVEFIDLTRDAPEPPPIDDGPPAPDRSWPIVRLAAGVLEALGDATRHNVATARNLVGGAVDLTLHPAHLASAVAALPADAAATTRSLVRQLGVVEPHRSPIWNGRSLDRRLETFEVSLAEAKTAAHALGGSVNDLFVAAAAGGAGAYHRRAGSDVAELRMSMPVSTRTERGTAGNSFTPTRVLVPVEADPRRRFAEIHGRLSITKTERAASLATSLAGLVNLLPHAAVIRLARQQVMTVDFATSNVRAAPFDLYMAGARMTANFPLGPVAGTAWNLTTMSYRGQLDCGLHVDPAAVVDPEQLRVDIEAAFAELVALG
jgi:diacylglycerol O-acyltransferase